jgi:proteasome lid subunit RPN8/RPN11
MSDRGTETASDSQFWFDFSEFVEMQKNPDIKSLDLPFETAFNDSPSDNVLDILNKRIELNEIHVPTTHGWNTLHDLLSIYRSKQYETVRYLLIDKEGAIVDHVALTNRIPDRARIQPDDMTTEEFLKEVASAALKNDYKIILVHNHPSGMVQPSNEDREITKFCLHSFADSFAGHLILDHGSYGLYVPEKDWEIVDRPLDTVDPLIKQGRKGIFSFNLGGRLSPEHITLLRCAMKIDDGNQWNSRDWVAVAFTSGWGELKALHYYPTSDFLTDNAADVIVKKTTAIALRSGAIWAFAFTDYATMLEPIYGITKQTNVFRDFYINGTIGSTLNVGGSINWHFKNNTEVASTLPLKYEIEREALNREQAGNPSIAVKSDTIVSDAEQYVYEGEKNMVNTRREGKELSQEQHQALVEFLGICGNTFDKTRFDTFYNDITSLRDFAFLKDYFPQQGQETWPRYHDMLDEQYVKESHGYHERFPNLPYPEPGSRPVLLENGEKNPHTPLDFLRYAEGVTSTGEYRELYENSPSFAKGTVKAVSPRRIALFHESSALPLVLADNTPEQWAKLYKTADDNGIVTNNAIPSPEDVESLGISNLTTAREHLENALSEKWQVEEFRKDSLQDHNAPSFETLTKNFYERPYTVGTEVPSFILQGEDGFTTYSGYSFKSMADDGRSLIVAKKSTNGNEEMVTISRELYKTMLDTAETHVMKKKTTKEILQTYDKMIAKDAEETRSNTAANFWHNYRILCREQANNPQEAMDVARAIVRQMPEREQNKFKNTIKAYEKATRKIAANPLLQPFVKPQETYNQRILTYYEENVRNLPIKDRTVNGRNALKTLRHGTEAVDVPGKPIDPALRLKIGDTVKLSLDCKTLFGEWRKRLPITELTIVSASNDLNKIVLLDKKGNSKYTLAKDAFTDKIRKLERRLEKKQRKKDRFESIRY